MTPSDRYQAWQRIGRAVRDAAPDVPELTVQQQDALWQRIVHAGAGTRAGMGELQ